MCLWVKQACVRSKQILMALLLYLDQYIGLIQGQLSDYVQGIITYYVLGQSCTKNSISEIAKVQFYLLVFIDRSNRYICQLKRFILTNNTIILYYQIKNFIHHISTMTKKTQPRAKIPHKLAKYVRATPIHFAGIRSISQPSSSHLILGGSQKSKLKNNANTWYPADDEKNHFKRRRCQPRKPVCPQSIKPGQIVILLAGAHRGRRVVVLKALQSGNLLVTGPHCINGVPLKRVNPAYVIRTSTTVSVDGVGANVDDKFFKRASRFTKDQLKHASEGTTKKVEAAKGADEKWRSEAKNIQKQVDRKLVENIKKVDNLKGYLGTRFTLYSNTRPHELVF